LNYLELGFKLTPSPLLSPLRINMGDRISRAEAQANSGQDDAKDLAMLGHQEELTRKFSLVSMLAMAFCVLGTWAVFAQNLAAALTTGGPVSIFWGLVLVTLCNLCVAVSLGELCSSMPTALGQAYWVYRLWNTPSGRLLSYVCASINTFGWWALTASQNAFMTEFLLGMKVMFDNEWSGASKGWVQFLIYTGITICFTAFNLVACRSDKTLPWFNNFVGVGFAGLFVTISIALLATVGAKSDLSFQSPSFVFGAWINDSGWPDGVIWFVGLVQAAYGMLIHDQHVHLSRF
jgi:amino acid transporter